MRSTLIRATATVIAAVAVVAATAPATTAQPEERRGLRPFIEQTAVFGPSADDRPNYRIPSVVQAADGDLLAIVERRNFGIGDIGDTDLVLKRSTDRGRTWGPEETIFAAGCETHTDPTPFVHPVTGEILVFFLRDKKQYSVTRSTDDGVSWSTPESIHDDIVPAAWDTYEGSTNPAPGSPATCVSAEKREQWESGWTQRYGVGPGGGVVRLSSGPYAGRILVSGRALQPETPGVYSTFVFYSDDDGATFQRGGLAIAYGNESQLVELSGGRVMMNSRDGDNDNRPDQLHRRVAISSDGGATWPVVYVDQNVPEPQVHASIERYPVAGRNLLLFANPNNDERTPEHPYGRENVSIRLSLNQGATWPVTRTIYPYASSYTDIVVLDDGTIGVIYERGEDDPASVQYWDQLHFARFNLSWVLFGGTA